MSFDPWVDKKVLIVDDSAEYTRVLRGFFEELGLNVVGVAENGLEALKLLEELKPQIVSLDIIMPQMDGIECFRKIMEKDDEILCFFISILAGDPRVSGAFGDEIPEKLFLAKPVDKTKLAGKLSELFNIPTELPPGEPGEPPQIEI